MSTFKLEIITEQQPTVEHKHASNWGDEAVQTMVNGFPMQLVVIKDGKAQFGFRILEDGGVILTDYANMCFRKYVEQNLRLTPDRPWIEEKNNE